MQIDYTSRDFAALKSDLISLISARTNTNWNPTDYSDLGHVLVEAFSYMGDVMSHYLDRIANETTIDTAIQRSTLLSLANLYDYKPSGPTPATTTVTFTNVSTNNIDIPIGTQVMAPLSFGPYAQVFFETTSSATALAPNASIKLPVTEGKTVNTDRPDLIDHTYNKPLPANLGSSSGLANQVFTIVDVGVIDSSVNVYVGQGVAFGNWTYQDTLLEASPTDNVFTTQINEDGTVNIVFGDGVNGAIPPSGQLISCLYKTSAGAAGNIKSLSITELTFIPGNVDPAATTYLTVTNSLPSTGGADADSITQLKKKIKAAVITRRRAVTLDDYAKLATLVSMVGKASVNSSTYSSVNLYVQPQNDGSAAPGYPQSSIVGIATTGTVVTFATDTDHGFSVGDVVAISGINPSVYNTSYATITAVPATSTFSIASTTTTPYVGGGLAISATPTASWTALSKAVSAYLADKIMIGTTVTVQPPVYVPVYISANVQVDPAYKNSDVKLGVYQAMLGDGGLFQYDNNTFARTISVSSVTTAIQNVPGVLYASFTKINTDNGAGVANIVLDNTSIPYLTASTLVITPTGGIS